jgi:hypothetical protein
MLKETYFVIKKSPKEIDIMCYNCVDVDVLPISVKKGEYFRIFLKNKFLDTVNEDVVRVRIMMFGVLE